MRRSHPTLCHWLPYNVTCLVLGVVLAMVSSGCSSEDQTSDPARSTPPQAARKEPWWCLCYQRVSKQDMTACRETASECEQLRHLIDTGNTDILAGSAQTSCEAVYAEHPGDLLGTRERWQPSQKAGAWVSPGSCLLRSRPN